jgi:phage FluMu protein Com
LQLDGEMMEVQEIKKIPKPKKADSESNNFQHVKILDCNEPVCRVICECWHCKQGLLSEVDVSTSQYLEVECPSCGKTAVRLMAEKVISTTPIPSPWQG